MLIEQPCKKNIRNMAKISLKPHLKLFYFYDFTVVVFCSMYRFLCHCHIWINQKWIKCLVKLHRWQNRFRECKAQLKVAFSQKGLMPLSFLQTGKPNYFPSKWLKSSQKRTLSCSNAFFEHSEQLHVLIWNDLSYLEWKKFKILDQENN